MDLEEAQLLTAAYCGTSEDMGAYFRWKVERTPPEERDALQGVFAQMWITWRMAQEGKARAALNAAEDAE